jgi:hypothetical protein
VKSAIVSSLLNEQVLFPNRGLSLHRFSSAYITLQVDCNILEGHLNVAFGDSPSQYISLTSLALPSIIFMAPSAQAFTHKPQPLHFSSSIFTMFRKAILKYLIKYYQDSCPSES